MSKTIRDSTTGTVSCPLCREGSPSCLVQHRSGLACTRKRGHEGPHVACTSAEGKDHEGVKW